MAKAPKPRTATNNMVDDITKAVDDVIGPAPDSLRPAYHLSTGITTFDLALSNGLGLPGGKLIEIYGPEQTGKSALAMQIIKQAQMRGGMGIWLDSEQSFDESLAVDVIGMDTSNRFYLRDVYLAEQTLKAIEMVALRAVDSAYPMVIVLDTIAGLTPESVSMDKEDIEGGTRSVASLARCLSWFVSRGLLPKLRGSNVYLVFLNQVRSLIGSYGYGMPTETTPGGKAIKFMANQRVSLGTITKDKDDREKKEGKSPFMAVILKASMVKNRCCTPFRSASIPLYFRKDKPYIGFDDNMSNLVFLLQRKLITHGGAYKTLAGYRTMGVEGLWEKMNEDPGYAAHVRQIVIDRFLWEYGETVEQPIPSDYIVTQQPEAKSEDEADEPEGDVKKKSSKKKKTQE
ncbi:MAG: hypothetical protein KDH96_04695 [Candidatus Riesia sp.]|nr:hypothetical protein [Candidatus Riesia sp.]